MLREQINIHVRPAWEYFSRCCVVAHEMIEADNVPARFREQFDHGEFIEQEYALPSKVLLIFALALELSFEMPSAEALTGFEEPAQGCTG